MKKYHQKKDGPSISHIHVVVPAAKWLTVLLAHIPDKYEHLVRYYGWYSNRARGARNAQTHPGANATTLHLDETPLERQSKANWARLIQKVYEADPLNCPKCGTTMRVIAVIDEPPVVRHILEHLRLWNPKSEEQRHPTRDPQDDIDLGNCSRRCSTPPAFPAVVAARRHHPTHLPSRPEHRLSRRTSTPLARCTPKSAFTTGKSAMAPYISTTPFPSRSSRGKFVVLFPRRA